LEKWRVLRQEIHDEVCAKGYNEEKQAFTQYYGAATLDASILMMPLFGFLPPTDPRVVSTVEAVQRELVEDGFVLRYRTQDDGAVDGLVGREGAFLACSFWLVDCLFLIGRTDEARSMFERLLALRNDLGLLSEEYDPVAHRLVGNFPQAFSHVSLVNSACRLTDQAPLDPDPQSLTNPFKHLVADTLAGTLGSLAKPAGSRWNPRQLTEIRGRGWHRQPVRSTESDRRQAKEPDPDAPPPGG
jgi:hypothetical protein